MIAPSKLPADSSSPESAEFPEYLPARMLNEYVYCPRLFYYEWVDQLFAHNTETIEGALRHAKIDSGSGALADADDLAAAGDTIHARSVTLSSDAHRLIAKLDLLEADGDLVTPVDYKRGKPKQNDETGLPEMWDTDRVQLAVQALVLRDNGYRCEEALIYYVATKQRVRVAVTEELIAWTLEQLAAAWQAARDRRIPPPLVDSPKCPRCSLVGICLPDETRALEAVADAPPGRQMPLFEIDLPENLPTAGQPRSGRDEPVRRLLPARDDLRPLYLNTQGLYVGKSGQVLKIKDKEKVVQEVRMMEISQLNLFGSIQMTTQTIQALCEAEIPIAYFSMGGWFYGLTQGLGVKNIELRRQQFRLADVPSFCLRLNRALVAGKIRNQRTLLQRNHIEPPPAALMMLKAMCDQAEHAVEMEELLGIEGHAARIYFENFAGMLKLDDEAATSAAAKAAAAEFPFDFKNRNRRPPRDPVNALLSLAYSVLAKDLTIITQAVGFDPYLGFYHQPRFGRASLGLDLMEPFRPLIADSAVLSAINTRMITPRDFVRAGDSVALKPEGRKAFFRAYEQRMDTLVTHPLFGYRVNYRRILEIQARLLARVLTGEIGNYPVFVTR